ncbi:MAG: hypothetical protein NXI14_00445 [bacterium]|nr:hypothetical protein [bacterium]
MSVFARLFRKSGRPKGSRHAPQISGVEVEPKPVRTNQNSDLDDQAARLRAAVASTKPGQVSVTASAQEGAFGLDDSGTWESDSTAASAVDGDSPGLAPDADEISAPNPAPLANKAKAPRNKQELIEELHRNYREVLGLVRKLDNHLDDARERSETIAEVSKRYEELAPAIQHLPREIRNAAETINADLRKAVGDEGSATRELLDRIESAIVHVGTDIERSTDQQGQLVQTMAEFRESLLDLSRSSTAACEAVRDFEQRAVERDNAMLGQIRQTRFWLIGLTVGVGVIGVAGLILGVLALNS